MVIQAGMDMADVSDTIKELQLRNAGLRQLVDELQGKLAGQQETIASQQETIASLKETVAHLQRMLFGRKSEKVVFDPSELLPGMRELFAQASENAGGEEKEAKTEKVREHERNVRRGQPDAGWNGFPEDLERVEKIVGLPEAERKGLSIIGYDTSERLAYRSPYYVQVVKRPRYADPGAPLAGVVTAPAPAVPSCLSPDSARCHYDLGVVVHVIVSKVVDQIPLYRQSEMFARLGVQFGRSAMCAYFRKVSDALRPLYAAMEGEVMACGVIHADETRVPMLDPKAGRTKTCWLWVRKTGYGPPLTVFHFSTDRSKDTAALLLGDYGGTIISDRYAAYGGLPAESAGCWAHCRRKFIDAQENHPVYASRALAIVRQLYLNESSAKDAALGKAPAVNLEKELFSQRRRVRALSAAAVDLYFGLCREIQAKEPPSSSIAKAASYSTNQEGALRRFLGDPRVNIDNNPCENVIRPFCVGRKNWLFVGNEDGGAGMAVLYSFAATCKDNGIDFEKWLLDVLPRLDTCPSSDAGSLLPHRWKPAP